MLYHKKFNMILKVSIVTICILFFSQTNAFSEMDAPSNEQKRSMAIMLIQNSLENKKDGETANLSWGDTPLFEMTPTETYLSKKGNIRCRKYVFVEINGGKAVTLNNKGDACRLKNPNAPAKWFPADMGKEPMTGREIMARLIGKDYLE